MIGIIILANVAAVFAYLAGGTTDISALVSRSEGKSKLFTALAIITLCLVSVMVINSN